MTKSQKGLVSAMMPMTIKQSVSKLIGNFTSESVSTFNDKANNSTTKGDYL